MNLTKALKEKKKLVKKASEAFMRFQSFNSREEGSSVSYDPEKSYNEWISITDQLIDLKARIQRANSPIVDKIMRMGELKSMASNLRGLNVRSGSVRERGYGANPETVVIYSAYMDIVARDEKIKSMEEEIEKLQEEIELHNATTKI